MRHELRHGELPSRGDHESEIVAGVQTEHRSSGSKRGPYDGMRNVGDRRRMGFRHGLHAGLVAPGEASSFGKGGHELPQRLSRRAEGSASGRDRVARSHEGDIHGQSPDGSSRALQRSGSDVLESEGFTKASRYRLVGTLEGAGSESPAEFLALYEVDTDDPVALNKTVAENLKKKGSEGRIVRHETCDVISAAFYTFISEVSHVPDSRA
jgi:hypothetical protein